MLLDDFVSKTEFDSYNDFYKNFKINIPENFNFGFDVVEKTALLSPEKPALVWCDEHGMEATFTFSEINVASNRVANFFKSIGIKKGDSVMLILKRHYEYWFCLVALHKIGAIAIPATHLLTQKTSFY